jgi:hypothetical protein
VVIAALSVMILLSCRSDTSSRPAGGLHLADVRTGEDWFLAMRRYPNGIPHGARAEALRAAERLAIANHRGRATPRALVAKSWFPLGPTPVANGPTYGTPDVPSAGRATVIAANPAVPDDVWLGTATGGVWHTRNAQSTDPTWVPVDGLQFPDLLPGPGGTSVAPGAMALSIGALAADGCSASGCSRVWIGTGENGIRRDTYYGAGLFLRTPFEPPKIARAPGSTAAIGDVLTQVADFRNGSIVSIALAPHAAGTVTDTLYVAVSSGVTSPATEATVTAPEPTSHYGIFATTNASTFTRLPIPGIARSLPTDIAIDPGDPSGKTLLVGFMARDRSDATAARGIFRGTNGGLTAGDWCSVNDNSVAGVPQCPGGSGLPPGDSVIANPPAAGQDEVLGYVTLRYSSSVANRVYALVGQCGQHTESSGCAPAVFRSDNGGLAWSPVSLAIVDGTNANLALTYARYTHALAVVPGGSAAAEQILIGGDVILSCSGLGAGCTAYGDSIDQTHPDHHDLVFPDPARAGVVYNTNDGGFFFSLDGGGSWSAGNSTLTTSQFDSLAVYDQNLFGGLQDQGVGYFTGTRVWADRQVGDGGAVVVYAFGSPPQTVWVYTGAEGLPYRSTNDPTGNVESLGSKLPATAQDQANGGAGPSTPNQVAQCAFFPPLAINATNHDLYFATTQVYKSTDTDDKRGDSWTTISPVLATPSGKFDIIDTDNVITALGVGDDGTVYVGTFIGEIWVSDKPCDNKSCWTQVAGPGTSASVPHLPISSFAVATGNSATAYVTLSGFGTPSHVWKTTDRGTGWTAASEGLLDTPASVVRFDSLGTLRLGTDIGLYTFDGTSWTRETELPFVPVTAIASWPTGPGTQRLYAGTHGRGAWVQTEPTVVTLEGWANGEIWDVPVYGYGFTNTTGVPVPCTVKLIQQSGTVCASGGVDVSRNDFGAGGTIEVDKDGQLQTTQPAPASTWGNKPVVWACNQGHCLDGTHIDACNRGPSDNQDLLSEVIVDCGVAGTGAARILGAPTLGNPPSSSLQFDAPPGAPRLSASSTLSASPSWSFEALVSLTTSTGASLICRTPVTVAQGAPDDQVVSATAAAIDADPLCQAAGVSAKATIEHITTTEDPGHFPPTVTLSASATSGSQIFVTFRSAPGAASGLCFNLAGLSNPTLHQTTIMQTVVLAAASGAAGGTLRFREDTDVGACKRDVVTTPGMTAREVAVAIGQAFTAVSNPGPADCIARNNPLDVEVGHLGQRATTLFTVISHKLQVCSFDPGVGFVVTPDSVNVPNRSPDCSTVAPAPGQLWPPNHKLVPVVLSSAVDPDGDPVAMTITQVRQDEDPGGRIDAEVTGGVLSLRAERDGNGDGRIYHVAFTAADAQGATCTGEVTVCVPHDQGKLSCGDQGALFASGIP